MRGDFSRWTFDPTKHYSRVLSLQGRVILDADFNEGLELLLHHSRRLTADLLGPHAGPGMGFELAPTNPASADFIITQGSYYVNGILCENPPPRPPPQGQPLVPGVSYLHQPGLGHVDDIATGSFLVYLDVWERFVTYIEDQDPAEIQQTIREVALGGPDTAARSKVVWQVRLMQVPGRRAPIQNDDVALEQFFDQLKQSGVIRGPDGTHPYGLMKARARKPVTADEPCAINPNSRYRGPENQLYRVEIHRGGVFPAVDNGAPPTFKWSRENASVVFPIRSLEGPSVTLETLGRDDRLGLKKDDWVEVVDDVYVLANKADDLRRVVSVDPETFLVQLDAAPVAPTGTIAGKHPILRRWEGIAPVSVNATPDTDGYLALEDGVEVHFSPGEFRTGDYWITPARTAAGDVEWPGTQIAPIAIPPHGILHSYAPLGVIDFPGGGGSVSVLSSMRRTIRQLWQ